MKQAVHPVAADLGPRNGEEPARGGWKRIAGMAVGVALAIVTAGCGPQDPAEASALVAPELVVADAGNAPQRPLRLDPGREFVAGPLESPWNRGQRVHVRMTRGDLEAETVLVDDWLSIGIHGGVGVDFQFAARQRDAETELFPAASGDVSKVPAEEFLSFVGSAGPRGEARSEAGAAAPAMDSESALAWALRPLLRETVLRVAPPLPTDDVGPGARWSVPTDWLDGVRIGTAEIRWTLESRVGGVTPFRFELVVEVPAGTAPFAELAPSADATAGGAPLRLTATGVVRHDLERPLGHSAELSLAVGESEGVVQCGVYDIEFESPPPGAAAAATPLELLESGADPRRVLSYRPEPGSKQRVTMQLTGELAVDGKQVGGVMERKLELSAETLARHDNGSFDVRLQITVPGLGGPPPRDIQIAADGRVLGDAAGATLPNGVETGFGVPFPAEPVGIGARWRISRQQGAQPSKTRMEMTYELVSADEKGAKLSVHTRLVAVPHSQRPPGFPPTARLLVDRQDAESVGTIDVAFDRPLLTATTQDSTSTTDAVGVVIGGREPHVREETLKILGTEEEFTTAESAAAEESPSDGEERR